MLRGPGDIVKDNYDAGLANAGGKLWRGTQTVAASGFGKGLLLSAIAVVAAITFTFGFGTYAGILTHGTSAASMVAPTLEEALTAGFGFGLSALASGFGIMAMVIGGTLGAVAETRQQQAKLSTEQAAQLAWEYAQARQSPQIQPSPRQAPDQTSAPPEKNFCACEMDRRAQAIDASQPRQGYGPG
ncbi:MAG: hypothetical protein KGI29_05655 [Pseudomonadota bacterium]|nr:hypothetical protein [Pseudomonadota bacterium]MDE3038164.1 hypothetical protein [Pseudomonadota bacterium]